MKLHDEQISMDDVNIFKNQCYDPCSKHRAICDPLKLEPLGYGLPSGWLKRKLPTASCFISPTGRRYNTLGEIRDALGVDNCPAQLLEKLRRKKEGKVPDSLMRKDTTWGEIEPLPEPKNKRRGRPRKETSRDLVNVSESQNNKRCKRALDGAADVHERPVKKTRESKKDAPKDQRNDSNSAVLNAPKSEEGDKRRIKSTSSKSSSNSSDSGDSGASGSSSDGEGTESNDGSASDSSNEEAVASPATKRASTGPAQVPKAAASPATKRASTAPVQVVTAPASEWERHWNDEYGLPYWYCEATDESTWTDPTGL